MEIHQLEQFKAIAESRTMREAADKLFISQPALSQNLKKLEAELGCTLFDRSHNQLSITPYGEILLAHAHRILFDLKEVSAEIDALKQQDAQTIHIDSFYLPLSLFVLPQVANTFPDLRFDASIVTSTVLAKRVIDGITDIAFLPRQFCPAHLAFRTIQEERLLLSLSPASPLVKRRSCYRRASPGSRLGTRKSCPMPVYPKRLSSACPRRRTWSSWTGRNGPISPPP